MEEFTKSDLKDYMKVVTRNGMVYIKEGTWFERAEGHSLVSTYKEDLTVMVHPGLDIIEVYEPKLDGWNLLWKREGTKYMLLFPREMFGKEYSLIADKRGTYQPYPIAYDIGPDTKRTFTKEEINEIPFSTDIFTKVEIER